MGSHLILVLTAAIWGLAFVAQRKSMESLDPLIFNGVRFALGAFSVLLIKLLVRVRTPQSELLTTSTSHVISKGNLAKALLLGLLLFIAASLQQTGMLWTSAGNAGFITGLYVVFVPLIGLFRKQRFTLKMILAVVLSIVGLLLLNNSDDIDVSKGNLFVLMGALFWAAHVQYIDKITKDVPIFDLAIVQFGVCSFLSLVLGSIHLLIKDGGISVTKILIDLESLALPVLYAGILSVGLAFTLQLHAQKRVEPHTASIILCLEGVFALVGGSIFLREHTGLSALMGSALLLCAMIVSLLGRGKQIFLLDKKTPLKN